MVKAKEKTKAKSKPVNMKMKCSSKACGSCGYSLGVIGAAVYYIQAATGFWSGVLGVLKALVWPAFLVYELLKMVGA